MVSHNFKYINFYLVLPEEYETFKPVQPKQSSPKSKKQSTSTVDNKFWQNVISGKEIPSITTKRERKILYNIKDIL